MSLVVHEPTPTDLLARRIEEAKNQIASLSTAEELRDAHAFAETAETYARTKNAREAYFEAGALKLRIERRAGELRKSIPRAKSVGRPRKFDYDEARRLRVSGMSYPKIAQQLSVSRSAVELAINNLERGRDFSVKDESALQTFDENMGISRAVGNSWERLADVPEEDFERIIEAIRESDGSLASTSFVRRATKEIERVERGIDRLGDGRLKIRWRKDGINRSKVLPHGDLRKARKELARVRGLDIKARPKVSNRSTIPDSQACVARALAILSATDQRKHNRDVRTHLDEAERLLHLAEDALVQASIALRFLPGYRTGKKAA